MMVYPQLTNLCYGNYVTISVSNVPGYSYQWQVNSINIPSATSYFYNTGAAGTYTCVVTNSCGSTNAMPGIVNVYFPATASITAAGPTTFCAPGSVQLNANLGSGLTYRWRLNSVNISGATAPAYVVGVTGNYDCIETNACGSATSNVITVTVNPTPTATITAAGPTTFCSPGSVTLNANTGPGLTYQWRFNSANISGATSSSYNATIGGNYDCVVTNACGSTISNVISVRDRKSTRLNSSH